VMPEGLLNGLRPQEVRDLFWVFAERGEVGKGRKRWRITSSAFSSTLVDAFDAARSWSWSKQLLQ